MRLLYVATGTNLGGGEMQTLHLARGMRSRGHDVALLSLAPAGPVAALARAAGLGVETLNIRSPRELPRAVAGIARVASAFRPDVLHSHLVHANLCARLSRVLTPVPALISTGHSVREGGRWSPLAYRLTDGLCDLTTNVSEGAVGAYRARRAVGPGKARHVPNGLDLAAFDRAAGQPVEDWPLEDGDFAWIAVGRFEEAKDHATLLRAFAGLDHPRARLLLVGEGRREPQVRALVAELGLGARVVFLGARGDVPALLRRADALVLSSAWEGLPMVVLEAGAAGRPAVSTRVGSVPGALPAAGQTFLVPPGDPAALAAAMTRLMALPEAERRAHGEAARAHIQAHYGLEAVLDTWEGLYAEVLARRRAPRPQGAPSR